MKKYTLLYSISLLLCLLFTTACKENDNTVDEYPNWVAQNTTHFNQVFTEAKQKSEAGDHTWKVFRKWSLPDESTSYTPANDDHIVAHVLQAGTLTTKPLSSDSVKVSYRARLLPSQNYPRGLVFLQTYTGDYNPSTNAFAILPVTGNIRLSNNSQVSVTDGLSTALQQMRIGDRWEVYIPAKLGYLGSEYNTLGIPQGSMLIFDITLLDIQRAE